MYSKFGIKVSTELLSLRKMQPMVRVKTSIKLSLLTNGGVACGIMISVTASTCCIKWMLY